MMNQPNCHKWQAQSFPRPKNHFLFSNLSRSCWISSVQKASYVMEYLSLMYGELWWLWSMLLETRQGHHHSWVMTTYLPGRSHHQGIVASYICVCVCVFLVLLHYNKAVRGGRPFDYSVLNWNRDDRYESWVYSSLGGIQRHKPFFLQKTTEAILLPLTSVLVFEISKNRKE
jgi:hypothetical protein